MNSKDNYETFSASQIEMTLTHKDPEVLWKSLLQFFQF